jgi:hypothetical protein
MLSSGGCPVGQWNDIRAPLVGCVVHGSKSSYKNLLHILG